ncbi:hypothetical protein H4R21_000936 [Coemansia helicoidea]|uniref:Uncharacterized protein n=1 Tax=Coemansia helicoidea TaxID=1286919 RepID=A0ACC1LE38_9FUNG|nr:hypothetical protein H4R21_000936 [Coemansia helicoidea]
MGIVQKDRRGTRGTKEPIPVPACWLARIGADRDDADDEACSRDEALLMQRLRAQAVELASSSGATWMEQSRWLKAVEAHLAGLKRLAEISPATLSYLRTVAIPMFVECFFLPADMVVRRQAIPVIKLLSLLDPTCVDSALQANLLVYIGAQGRYEELCVQDTVDAWCAGEAYGRQTAGQRAIALEVLANFPLGLSVMGRFASDILAYAATALDQALPCLYAPPSGSGSVELAALADACTQHMRLACLCVTKLVAEDTCGADGSLQEAILASMRSPAPKFVDETLARTYGLAWQLVDCDRASLNGRQVAAMVLVALIDGAGLSREARAMSLAARALDITVRGPGSLPAAGAGAATYLPGIENSASRQHCMGDAVSMICIARAIVALASYETTLVTLDIAPSARIPSVCSTVHEAVFTHIASICGRSQLAPGVKVIVFEAMAIWLQETAKLLGRCLQSLVAAEAADEATQAFNATAFALGQRVLVLQRERIMGYLWAYWDDPIDAVQAKVRNIFEAFLDIGSAMNQAIVADPTIARSTIDSSRNGSDDDCGDESHAFLDDVLRLVLSMDWSRRVKYSLLATLSTRISVLDLLRGHPEIIERCLETMAQVTVASRAASLLSTLLECTAELLGQPDSRDGALEAECVQMWVAPVVAALCKDDDTSRRMLAQLLLPGLFERLPRVVGEILRELMAYQRPADGNRAVGHVEAAWQQQTLDSCRQHALIVVLKVARSQDAITIEQLATMDAETAAAAGQSGSGGGEVPVQLMSMLSRAVCHPDWSVRADMVGLLCESRKMTTPPSAVEYDLLFRLLRVSANAPSADYRQRQYGALTTLAQRLAAAASHAERVVATGRLPVPSQKVRHREKARRDEALAEGRAKGLSDDQILRELGILPQDELVAQSQETLAQVQHAVGRWIDLTVRGCLYPGAGFSKVAMGLQWLDILARYFAPASAASAGHEGSSPPVSPSFVVAALAAPDFRRAMDGDDDDDDASAQTAGVTAEEAVTVLTQVLIDDPFEVNRSRAFALLTAWPLVPPGDPDAARAAQQWATRLLQRALHMVSSTRAGESESGALLIRWLFRKFVVLQGIRLDVAGPVDSDQPHTLAFVAGLLERIRRCQAAAERNLLDAAQSLPLHGLLTAAQYVVREIDGESPAVQAHGELWRAWIRDLTQSATAVCDVVLGVLTSASPEGNIPASFREMETKIDDIIRSAVAADLADDAAAESDGDDDGDAYDVNDDLLGGEGGPAGRRQQVILSYCWRAVKEVAGLLAAVATSLAGADQPGQGLQGAAERCSAESRCGAQPLAAEATVGRIGALLHTLLTSIRHRGAFSAVHPAFREVCGRMYQSPAAALNQQVGRWLDQCLDAAAICKVSVTRRSAGWPLCLLAIVTCDKLATQALLPRAMDRIFGLAGDLLTGGPEANDDAGGVDGTTDLPQVHALNMLRELVDDHTLASEVVPYVEQAYVLSLTGLQSRKWAIRNACSLLYAALTRRVFGNSRAREETKYDGITGRELFTRFPGLHPFLTRQLESAVDRLAVADMMRDGSPQATADALAAVREAAGAGAIADCALSAGDPVGVVLRSGARFIHPALYPCLILLARLQPSLLDASKSEPLGSGAGDEGAGAPQAEPLPGSNGAGLSRPRRPSHAAEAAGVVASPSAHAASATEAVAPPMNLDSEPLTRVNERNSTVHVTSASTMLSMYSFTGLVETCVDNPVFKTREMAARAFAPLIPSDQAAAVCASLLRSIREAGDAIAANSCHGALCQAHELLRLHWRLGDNGSETMRRAFIRHVFPALSALWPVLIQSLDRDTPSGLEPAPAHETTDVVRHKYLTIINDFVARGETWLLGGVSDRGLVRTVRVLLSRFRLTILYGSLHPLLAEGPRALERLGSAQVPGAYGTVLELTRLYLACVDYRTVAVVRDDGSVQLEVDGELMDEHGLPFDDDERSSSAGAGAGAGGSEIAYNPWPVLSTILASNEYYEAKLCVLEWMADHTEHERMEIVDRIGVDNLLPLLITDALGPAASGEGAVLAGAAQHQQSSRDPLVRAAAIRLLTLLCTKLDIDVRTLPVGDVLAFWDSVAEQLAAPHCALSVSTALVEFQAALVHMVHAYALSSGGSGTVAAAGQRALAWARRLHAWADAEMAAPYRRAVSRALVTYSAIKRYKEAAGAGAAVAMDGASEEIIRLCFWRLLQDDDEEIREYVAASISRRIGQELACDQASEKLVADYMPPADGPFPHAYVGDRLAYLLALDAGQTVADAVHSAVSPGRALFEHESPNVYIDEPRNVQLAYYSLVSIADAFSACPPAIAAVATGAQRCVDALAAALAILRESREAAMRSGVMLAGALGVTSLASLFPLLQSWILGARLALFAASRLDDPASRDAAIASVRSVADAWLGADDLRPVHPWVARALRSLQSLAHCAAAEGAAARPVPRDQAVADLFLLTFAV